MKNKRNWIVSGAYGAALICVLFSLAVGAVRRSPRQEPPALRALRESNDPKGIDKMFDRLAVNTFMADVSLEVREQDDFLLTPALLVQEAISDGVVLTYPEE